MATVDLGGVTTISFAPYEYREEEEMERDVTWAIGVGDVACGVSFRSGAVIGGYARVMRDGTAHLTTLSVDDLKNFHSELGGLLRRVSEKESVRRKREAVEDRRIRERAKRRKK